MAFFTSSPDTIPAPQSNFVEFLACLIARDALVINSGFCFETAFPEPISSGGSIAKHNPDYIAIEPPEPISSGGSIAI